MNNYKSQRELTRKNATEQLINQINADKQQVKEVKGNIKAIRQALRQARATRRSLKARIRANKKMIKATRQSDYLGAQLFELEREIWTDNQRLQKSQQKSVAKA